MKIHQKVLNLLISSTLLLGLSGQATDTKATATPGKITIKVLGEVKFEGSIEELSKIAAPKTVKFIEPHLEKERSFGAFGFRDLMDKLKASDWKKAKTMKVTCADGYSPVVLTSNLMRGEPHLAFRSDDKEAFQIEKSGKPIEIAPLYLVWTQKMSAAQRKISLSAGNWPYQIVALSFE